MKKDLFGLKNELIEKALKEGVLVHDGKDFRQPPGAISLVYHPMLRRFVFVFGNSSENAGFVLLEDMNKTWKLK